VPEVSLEVVEELKRRLKEEGFKVSTMEEGSCWLVAAQLGERVFLVSLRRGRFSGVYVAKVVTPEKLPATAEWSCELLDYTPHGFYVLESDVGKLVEEVRSRFGKLEKLLSK